MQEVCNPRAAKSILHAISGQVLPLLVDGVPGSRMAGTIVLAGRSKDTIVLSNGENVEPQPIEDACCASSYISHMLVVGQDKRMLGALVAPHTEAFEELEKVKGRSLVLASRLKLFRPSSTRTYWYLIRFGSKSESTCCTAEQWWV